MRRIAVGLAAVVVGMGSLACVRDNPAFDLLADDETGDGDPGDGDGDPGDGDGDPGDGDGDPGDGDGDPGDGDGDGDPGDGDGDPGDGDGDPGDGDGDPGDLCEAGVLVEPYGPALIGGAVEINVADAPGFALQEPDCQTLTICHATQPDCGPLTSFIARISAGGVSEAGVMPAQVVPIQLRFSPGKESCGMPPLILDPSQTIKIHALNGANAAIVLPVRLPCFEGTELSLWVGHDGSSFYDPELFEAAALW